MSRYLDENLVEVLKDFPAKLGTVLNQSSMRQNDLLDAVMASSGPKPTTLPRGGDPRKNDLLDDFMGYTPKPTVPQSGERGLVHQPRQNSPVLFQGRENRNLVAQLSQALQGVFQSQSLAKNQQQKGDGGDCCYLIAELVDVAKSIESKLGAMSLGGGSRTFIFGQGGQPNPNPPNPNPPPPAGKGMRKQWEPERGPFTTAVNYLTSKLQGLMGAISNPSKLIDRGEQQAYLGEKMQARGKAGGTWTEFKGRSQQAGGHFLQGMQNPSGVSGAGDLLRAGGSIGGMIPVVGKAVDGLGKLGDTIFKSLDRFKEWNEQLKQGNFRFAEFSGAMTQVMVESEMRRMMISRQQGDIQAPTARFQAEAADKVGGDLAKVGSLVDSAKNLVSGGFSKLIAPLTEAIGDLAEAANEQLNKLVGDGKEEEDPLDLGEIEQDLEVIRRRNQANRPARFR